MSQVNPTEDFLEHYGVKGMKWGVRKDRKDRQLSTRRERYNELRNAPRKREIEVTTKNGVSVKAIEIPNGRVFAFLASFSKTGVEYSADCPNFRIESGGKHVGQASFQKKSSDEINLTWLGVKPSERGKGYASAILAAAVEYGKAEGVSKLTLEVPGNAPDARHIYEKQGFKVVREPTAKEIRNTWGGLTEMALDLTEESIRHTYLSEDEELELAFEQTFPQLTESQEELVFGNSDDIAHSSDQVNPTEDFLEHYGVKGMKWGVRKDRRTRNEDRREAREAKKSQKQANKSAKADRRSSVKQRRNLSDADIDALIKRLEKEKKLKDLTAKDTSPGRDFIKSVATDAGKQAATRMAAGAAVYLVKAALTKEFNLAEAAAYVAPKPKK